MKTPWEYAAKGDEYSHQTALFMWAAMAAQFGLRNANDPNSYLYGTGSGGMLFDNSDAIPSLKRLFAINNAIGRNNAIAGARSIANGTRAGVPDIMLPVAGIEPDANFFIGMKIKHGLFLELKRPSSQGKREGKLSIEQEDWIAYLRKAGYAVEIAYGWEQARDVILKYLGIS